MFSVNFYPWTYFLGIVTSLFSVLNPISASVIFASSTAGLESLVLKKLARRACYAAAITMIIFALLGQFIFTFFGFTALAMRLVGGVLVLQRAFTMLYSDDHQERLSTQDKEEAGQRLPKDSAIIPFGIPLLAGPGAISSVMGFVADASLWKNAIIIFAIIVNTVITYFFLSNATWVFGKLGSMGTKVLNKLMGLILAGVGMQFLINGILSLAAQIKMSTGN